MKEQSMHFKEIRIEKTKGFFIKNFWQRQFQTETTKKQKIFDWTFGIILPVICIFFDPTVFKGGIFSSGAFMADYKPFAYALSFVSIVALLAFMLLGEKLRWINGFISGLFAVGAIISLALGIVIFPFSLLGLIILIGILEFVPFFTGFVLLRNAVRSYRNAQPFFSKTVLIHSFFLSAILSLVIPFVLNEKAKHGLETMKHGNAQTIRATAKRFKYIAPLVNFDSLWECDFERDSERDAALAESFYELTGNDLKTLKEEKLKMRMAE